MNPLTLQQQIFVQLLIAFGQGAGTMPIARDTIAAIAADYGETIDLVNETKWKDIEVTTLAAAQRLGRLAAFIALSNNGDTVLRTHYSTARARIQASFPCPFCLATA